MIQANVAWSLRRRLTLGEDVQAGPAEKVMKASGSQDRAARRCLRGQWPRRSANGGMAQVTRVSTHSADPARMVEPGRPVRDVCARRQARSGRPGRAGHEHGDPQARLEQALRPQGRHHRVRSSACCWECSSARRRRTPRRCRSGCRCRTSCRRWPLQRPHDDDALYRGHPRLPGAGRDAVGAQPGLAPRPASPAAGQRGHRRGHGQPHPGWLIRYRELCGIWPHRGAGRESVHHQPAAWARALTRRTSTSSARCGRRQPSVYGPIATVIQRFAASIGGANAATTIWVLMILNGAGVHRRRLAAAQDL